MKIQIAPPCSLHGIGKRANNEDNLFPAYSAATIHDRLFMVCDGVGGSEKGEIASQITCRAIPEYYSRNRVEISSDESVHNAIGFAKSEIEGYLEKNPGSEGMATTVTLLHLHESGATVAHIGDSRVYHIRNGKILWKTRDHSYVNNLVQAGVITETEALTHPQRNVIMRALQGNERQVAADVHTILDIQANDYFFLCSDGILEGIDEPALEEILNAVASDEAKMRTIENKCLSLSNDNFTAYLVRIQSVENLSVELLDPVDYQKKSIVHRDDPAIEKNFLQRGVVWLLAFALVVAGWYFYKQPARQKKPSQKIEQPMTVKDSASVAVSVEKPMKAKPKVKLKKKSKKGEIPR